MLPAHSSLSLNTNTSSIGAPNPPILDTGATAHFFPITEAPVNNIQPLAYPLPITTPDGSLMHATHVGTLQYPQLPIEARHAYLVPELSSKPLISIGVLCDAGCRVTFDRTSVQVVHDHKLILTGHREPQTRLWEFHPTNTWTSHQPNRAIEHAHNTSLFGGTTIANQVAFAHACFFSPVLSTFKRAIALNYIQGFPGLSSATLKQHPPTSTAMFKGHLDQVRKNLRSTRKNSDNVPVDSAPEEGSRLTLMIPNDAPDDDEHPNVYDDNSFPAPSNARSHYVFATTFEPTGKFYSDITGKFVSPSSSGNNYILVAYDYDTNAIQAIPMKSRAKQEHLAALRIAHSNLVSAGCRPSIHFLDNECSDIVKQFMKQQQLDYQLVPPDIHRRNAAERAIRTFKNHFIAGLCSTDPTFPIHLWDKLLPQATLTTLNLMRGS